MGSDMIVVCVFLLRVHVPAFTIIKKNLRLWVQWDVVVYNVLCVVTFNTRSIRAEISVGYLPHPWRQYSFIRNAESLHLNVIAGNGY